jgi:hypothetical protein
MIMRVIIALLALLAAIAGSVSPVSADYPWCLYGGELGYSGDCSYQTREQCLASASGRSILSCSVNPRLLFERQRALQQQGVQQDRRHRRDY